MISLLKDKEDRDLQEGSLWGIVDKVQDCDIGSEQIWTPIMQLHSLSGYLIKYNNIEQWLCVICIWRNAIDIVMSLGERVEYTESQPN